MRLLLDTHIFLWLVGEPERLSEFTLGAIRDSDNDVYLSVVSLWEIIVKHQIGRMPLPEPPDRYIVDQREKHLIDILLLDESSVSQLVRLPLIHRDPFDRMLVCQAIEHDLTIVTVDRIIPDYPVSVFDQIQASDG